MLNRSPNRPRITEPLVNPKTGLPSREGFTVIEEGWRQYGSGFPVVPCNVSGTNSLTVTPILNSEGGNNYGNYMMWSFVAAGSSTGPVTANIGGSGSLKVYKSGGSAQADNGDITASRLYLLTYNSALNAAAGGFVLTAM